jgi:hypothetical protein
MAFRSPAHFTVFLAIGLLAAGCSADARSEEDLSDDELAADDTQYSFRYELPPNALVGQPLTKTFPFEIEKHGVTLKAKLTPTAAVTITSPVVEGKATVGKRRIASALLGRPVPKILDAEIKATSAYRAKLDVDIELEWSKTAPKPTMDDVVHELNLKTLAQQAMTLASEIGKKDVPLIAPDGTWREDMPLGIHYDVVVTCNIDELDGNLAGKFDTGIEGTLVARAIYNVDGVEERRFRRDPTHKFELDTSDFKVSPDTKFQFKGGTQHIKGSCSVQPVAVVQFTKDSGVRVRVDARSTFETTVAAREDMTPEWRLYAVNELNVWGEADITVPIVHMTIDKKALLFSKTFPKIDVAIE